MAYVFDTNGDLQNVLEGYISLEWSRPYIKPGAFKMQINRNLIEATQVQRGQLLAPTEAKRFGGTDIDHLYIIEQLENQINQDGSASEVINLSGRSVGGMFEERLALPSSGTVYDEQSSVAAETAMKHYVTQNTGSGASANRQIPNLVVTTDQTRGATISYKARYETVAEVLETISNVTTLGWEVTFDETNNNYEFDVISTIDKTEGSANPVYFDVDFETILETKYLTSDMNLKSYAYVGGQGEGTGRTFVETYIASSEPTGFDRREVFVDGANLDTTNTLSQKGDSVLEDSKTEDVIEVKINSVGSFRYREDWDIGNTITVRNEKWGLKTDLQIIGITLKMSPDRGIPEILVQLGTSYPTITSQVKSKFGNNTRQRV